MRLTPKREQEIRERFSSGASTIDHAFGKELLAEIDALRAETKIIREKWLNLSKVIGDVNARAFSLDRENQRLRDRIVKLRECLNWYGERKVEIPYPDGTVFDWGTIARKSLERDDEMEK